MADAKVDPKAYPLRVEGTYADDALFLVAARVEEGVNFLTRIDVEFVSNNRSIDLTKIVGDTLRVVMEAPNGRRREFSGLCVTAEFLGSTGGPDHFRAEVRPWFWFLCRTADSRVYQDIRVPDLVTRILGEYGFSGNVDNRLTGDYEKREYVVQYRETDLAFLTRLMEEEGIYHFFAHKDGQEKLVLADSISAHQPIPGEPKVPFIGVATGHRRQADHIYDLSSGESATSGVVTLNDFDFENPGADLFAKSSIVKGKHAQKGYEVYDYPGGYRKPETGNHYARVRMEAEAAQHKLARGAGNISTLAVGSNFEVTGHPRRSQNAGFTLIHAVHQMHLIGIDGPPLDVTEVMSDEVSFATPGTDHYQVRFTAMPKDEQYRAPLVTPKPRVSGIHTAIVTGPWNEEIWTDKYGRVKVQFHWDREGNKDEKSSCWVRTMMPWTGKNWGAIAIPRIGQEVVVDFEEGDPDRPIIVGMLYNGDTMPPYKLPDNRTQSGLVTRSTKQGGADTFHELIFEDKKGEELVRFQSERDYKQTIKNNATITVGLEHRDAGDLDLTVHHALTETIKTGDHTYTVEQGNVTEEVKQGNVTRTLGMGNESTTLKLGNYDVETKVGSIGMKAMQEIKLEVGQNSITINQMGITIKGMMITVEGQVMTTVKGNAMLTLKGGLVMIN